MAKIKYRQIDEEKLRKAIREYNRKIRKINKTDPESALYQPKILNLNHERKKIKQADRSYFNNFINSLNRYLKPGAEQLTTNKQGVIMTKWEVKEVRYKLQAVNRYNKKLAIAKEKNAEGRMGTVYDNEFKPFKNLSENIMNRKTFVEYLESLEQTLYNRNPQIAIQRYYDNYLKAIKTNFGTNNEFYRGVKSLTPKEVYEATINYARAENKFLYDENQEREFRYEVAMQRFKDLRLL